MKRTFTLVMALLLCLTVFNALAAFPEKEIVYLCGYGAGGSSDLQARLMQPYADTYFGKPLIVENLAGAGGMTALTDYRTRAADGYTISSFNTTPLLRYILGGSDFDYFETFDFLACVITTPIVVVVTAESPYQTIEELVKAGKEQPDELLYASAGAGSITHLASELWKYNAGLEFVHVPFNGGTDALTALLNGTVDFEVASLSEVLTKHEDGSLRILASCTDTPIMGTDGVTDLNIPVLEGSDVKVIQGVCVLKTVPEDIKTKLADALEGICNDPGYVRDMQAAGYQVDYMNSEVFTQYLIDSAEEFRAVVEAADLWDEVN